MHMYIQRGFTSTKRFTVELFKGSLGVSQKAVPMITYYCYAVFDKDIYVII